MIWVMYILLNQPGCLMTLVLVFSVFKTPALLCCGSCWRRLALTCTRGYIDFFSGLSFTSDICKFQLYTLFMLDSVVWVFILFFWEREEERNDWYQYQIMGVLSIFVGKMCSIMSRRQYFCLLLGFILKQLHISCL